MRIFGRSTRPATTRHSFFAYRGGPQPRPLSEAKSIKSAWPKRWIHYSRAYWRDRKLFIATCAVVQVFVHLTIGYQSLLSTAIVVFAFIVGQLLAGVVFGAGHLNAKIAKRNRRDMSLDIPKVPSFHVGHVSGADVSMTTDKDGRVSIKVTGNSSEVAKVALSTTIGTRYPIPQEKVGPGFAYGKTTPEIDTLMKLLRKQDFDEGRIAILRSTPPKLTVAAAARLLSEFDYDDGRTLALDYLALRITDPENAFMIVEAYEYDSSKDKAIRLIEKWKS